jgi:hypothetical protein
MLASNTRNSYQHHRHYSASSLPRYDPRMYSIDNRSEQQHTPANIGQLLNPVNHHHQQGNENNDLMYQRSSLTNGEMPLPF